MLESIFEWCLLKELELNGYEVSTQESVVINYKGFSRKETLRLDMLVEGCVSMEVKAVEMVQPVHKVQLLSYMKLLDVPIGLLLNFHEIKLLNGLSRWILPEANQ